MKEDFVPVQIWVPVACLAIALLVQAVSVIVTAIVSQKTKEKEVTGLHRTKMIELAVTTANSEFEVSNKLMEGESSRTRPMSSYVLFYFSLFGKLERTGPSYGIDAALAQTLADTAKIFPVYAQSGFPEYGEKWNVDPPSPAPGQAVDANIADERRHASLLSEHDAMLERVRHATNDLSRTETIIPLSIAVFYAWLYDDTGRAPVLPWWLWLVPVLMTMLGGLRQYLRYRYLSTAHNYMKQLERQLYPAAADADLGWNAYSEATDKSRHRLMRAIFWALLAVGTIAVAIRAWTS